MNGGQKKQVPPLYSDPYKNKTAPPKGIKDIPRFLRELIGGFFSRLGYIIGMVWKTSHWILILMIGSAVLLGILPVVGSILSKEILNELQKIISGRAVAEASGKPNAATFFGSMAMLLLIFFFIFR